MFVAFLGVTMLFLGVKKVTLIFTVCFHDDYFVITDG